LIGWLKKPNHAGTASRAQASSILVPVTGARCDEDVVRMGCDLLDSGRSKLYMVYVIEVARDSPIDAVMAFDTERGEETLRQMETVANGNKCTVEAQLVQARKAAAAVVREAVDRGVDAIVVGAPYRRAIGSSSPEDYVLYLLRHAPCRVIVVRESAALGDDQENPSSVVRA
jgi:nucleotide-binding universal stress UspA family protein